MKTLIYLLLAGAFILGILSGCGGSSNSDTTATTTVTPPPQTLLKGVVSDESGDVLPGVTVAVGTETTTTGADGTYSLSVTPGTDLKVNASKAGRLNTFHIISLSSGQSLKVDFRLRGVGSSNTLTNMNSQLTTATEARGAVVTLPAGSVVDSTGAAVTTATVEVTTSLASDSNYADTFPGMFVGTKAGTDTPIESFGIITVNITSGGNKCNLGSGKTADIAIPVAVGADPGAGTPTIDLWSLDETSGKWTFEGIATRDASTTPVVYRATVSHFSTYNLDRAVTTGMPYNVTIKNSSGSTVAGADLLLTSKSSDGAVWEGRGITGADGTYRFSLVPAGTLSLTARSGTQKGSGYSYDITGGEAYMTVTLIQTVAKTFTVELPDQTPASNASVMVYSFSEGVAAHSPPVQGVTSASGKVTLELQTSATTYNYSANIAIGIDSYSVSGAASTVEGIPAKWTLIKL